MSYVCNTGAPAWRQVEYVGGESEALCNKHGIWRRRYPGGLPHKDEVSKSLSCMKHVVLCWAGLGWAGLLH